MPEFGPETRNRRPSLANVGPTTRSLRLLSGCESDIGPGRCQPAPRAAGGCASLLPGQHAGCNIKLGTVILVGQLRLKLASLWLPVLLNYNLNLKRKI